VSLASANSQVAKTMGAFCPLFFVYKILIAPKAGEPFFFNFLKILILRVPADTCISNITDEPEVKFQKRQQRSSLKFLNLCLECIPKEVPTCLFNPLMLKTEKQIRPLFPAD
jgi:hypothetical protein